MLIEKAYEYATPSVAEKVLLYILEHVDDDFIFSRTYNEIQKDTGASQPTIARVFATMVESGAIEHVDKSRWKLTGIVKGWVKKPSAFGLYVRNKGA